LNDLLKQAEILSAEIETGAGASSSAGDDAAQKLAKLIAEVKQQSETAQGSDEVVNESEDGEPDVESSRVQRESGKQTAGSGKKASGGGRMNTNIPCKYYLRDGQCRRKDCRFLHHIPGSDARKSIYERVSVSAAYIGYITNENSLRSKSSERWASKHWRSSRN
jgi:hypothetical protein